MAVNNTFTNEMDFENTVIKELTKYKWSTEILEYPSEQDLINNWARILFETNRQALCNYSLTTTEMQQVLAQVEMCASTRDVNRLINGRTILIKRDNPEDSINFGRSVSLKIYDRLEIAAGKSVYQIAKEPRLTTPAQYHNKRADAMLLINGMPVIHIEFKKTGVPVTEAVGQIEQYKYCGAFSGIFKLIQVFVTMTPEETLYFANNDLDENGHLNRNNCFHWADFNNDVINDWQLIVQQLLSIPMAHQLIGFYTIPDENDETLKVMRSYQCYATNQIVNTVITHKEKWNRENNKGGYVWHTTGSGKTLTSFKCAQLITFYKCADKVLFLVDRKELGTQSYDDYENFANDTVKVNKTENTFQLKKLLESTKDNARLIVTSIQKMSRINANDARNSEEIVYIDSESLKAINKKRIVIIVDECHRSVYGKMLRHIQKTFPNALYFGFTGTPIYDENAKNGLEYNTTKFIFGNELHRYTIADGMRDGNVLGFDPYKVPTFNQHELRHKVALKLANATSEDEVFANKEKKKKYLEVMDENKTPMAGYFDKQGEYHPIGIEDKIPRSQFETKQHREVVVDDIISNWRYVSNDSMFHALFATSSIKEAIEYYYLFKEKSPDLKVFSLFDPNIDNSDNNYKIKEETILDILNNYSETYGKKFYKETDWDDYKIDVARRLAHKKQYLYIDNDKSQQIDILIVVDQMLTGFDSKWINAVYLDKFLLDEHIVQTFSRTNRIFNPREEKQFGTIKYYRWPFKMEKYVERAFEIYSGERRLEVFVPKIENNLIDANKIYAQIIEIFDEEGIHNLSTYPKEKVHMKQFASLTTELVSKMESARVQGFSWDDEKYRKGMYFSEIEYQTIIIRYKEMMDLLKNEHDKRESVPPFEVSTYVYELKGENINAEALNAKFDQYKKNLPDGNNEILKNLRQDLSNAFDSISEEDQKYAKVVIDQLDSGDLDISEDKSFYDYIYDLKMKNTNNNIAKCADGLGIEMEVLEDLVKSNLNKRNLDEGGKFSRLISSINPDYAKPFLERYYGRPLPQASDVMLAANQFLEDFILNKNINLD